MAAKTRSAKPRGGGNRCRTNATEGREVQRTEMKGGMAPFHASRDLVLPPKRQLAVNHFPIDRDRLLRKLNEWEHEASQNEKLLVSHGETRSKK